MPSARKTVPEQAIDRWLAIRLREGYDAILHQAAPDTMLALLQEERLSPG